MTTDIEARIEALEAALTIPKPMERMVITIGWVNGDRTVDPVTAYSDGCGRELQREPDESPEVFQTRAENWIRTVHRHKDPLCCCVLFPT